MRPHGSNIRFRIKSAFARVCLAIIFSNCISPAELAIVPSGGRLTVAGQISTLEGRTYIELGTTADTERLPNPLSGATVWLVDEIGEMSLFRETKPGQYRLSQAAFEGKTYFVRVQFGNGKVYESRPESVPAYSGTDATSYDFSRKKVPDIDGIISDKTFVNIYVNSQSPTEQEPFIKWEVEEVFVIVPTTVPGGMGRINPSCYVTQNADPQNIVIVNRSEFAADRIENLLVATRMIDQSFHTRHYFNVYHSAISREAFDYWKKVDILANNVGSIFDTPPAEIKGNMFNVNRPDELVLGYFQVVNETLNRFYLLEGDLPYRLRDYCEYLPFRDDSDYPSECKDCLLVRNSSYERPDWF